MSTKNTTATAKAAAAKAPRPQVSAIMDSDLSGQDTPNDTSLLQKLLKEKVRDLEKEVTKRKEDVDEHCENPLWKEWMKAKFENHNLEDNLDEVVDNIQKLEDKKVSLEEAIKKSTEKLDMAREKAKNSKGYRAWWEKQEKPSGPFKIFNNLNANWQEAVDDLEKAKEELKAHDKAKKQVKKEAVKKAKAAGKKAEKDKKKAMKEAQKEAKKLQKAADEQKKIEIDKKIAKKLSSLKELEKEKKEMNAKKPVARPKCQYCDILVTECNARKVTVFGEASNRQITVEEYVESLPDGPEKEAMRSASTCKRQNGGRKRKSPQDSPQASPQISEAPGLEPAPKATEIDMKAEEQQAASNYAREQKRSKTEVENIDQAGFGPGTTNPYAPDSGEDSDTSSGSDSSDSDSEDDDE